MTGTAPAGTANPTGEPRAPTGPPGSRGPYDAIVVGAGHNGLVTAAYLARAGLRTLVLEPRERVGGQALTTELVPGIRVPTLAHTVGRLSPAIVRELDLRRHGLSLLTPEARVFAPTPDGDAITLWAEPERTAAELRDRSPSDADAWPAFDRHVRSLARFLATLAAAPPPEIRSPGAVDALLGLRVGWVFRSLPRPDRQELLRALPMAVADFVSDWLADDALRAVVAWRGVRFSALGTRSAGTTAWLLTDSTGADAGAAGEVILARGGPGALAEALALAARSAGAEIRTGAEVVAVTTDGERVTGVALADGEEIRAPVVAAALDPKRLLTGLLDPAVVGPTLRWRAAHIRTPGATAKVNLVLARLPVFPAARDVEGDPAGAERRLHGRIVVAGRLDDLERAHDAAKYGRIPDRPVVEATIPSLADPGLVAGGPPGAQVMSVIVQYAPYRLRDASWDDSEPRETLYRRTIGVLESIAPGIGELVVAREVVTPADLEREWGASGGHPLHGEPSLDQFYLWRPLLGHAGHRIGEIDGLYLCGSGAHPGGGVTGLPGRNAARTILADRRRPRRA